VIGSDDALSAPLLERNFDLLAAAARRAVRGRRAPVPALNAYLATLRVAALVADDAGCYVGANEPACRLTGYTIDELLALSVPDLTAQEDAAPGTRLWNSFVRSDYQRGTFVMRRKDDTPVRVLYHAYANVAEGMHVSFLVAADEQASGL